MFKNFKNFKKPQTDRNEIILMKCNDKDGVEELHFSQLGSLNSSNFLKGENWNNSDGTHEDLRTGTRVDLLTYELL